MTIDFTQRVRPADDVLVRELGGESVLLNLANESYYGLDQVGTRIWTVLTTAQSIQVGCEQLLAEFEVEAETLRDDVSRLVGEMSEQGLVVVE